MENASKALIIAGSILLAVMIVALGVFIFTKAQNSTDTGTLDATEISMFNSKFDGYEGDQLGTNVKTLLSKLISNAGTNSGNNEKLPLVKLEGASDSSLRNFNRTIDHISGIKAEILSTTLYNVKFTYNSTNGMITEVTIKTA